MASKEGPRSRKTVDEGLMGDQGIEVAGVFVLGEEAERHRKRCLKGSVAT
jgi:hypothetical protein